ncbi:MAG TPA: helix-turn-helix domain-containing GNAT family N-acetyltransferase [Acidimicrobiales bacterium]|nr:helix-turn-helix domain-containing GNAT family N-acetyltransferase [Acidimicrobiales bacterium]
MDGTMIDQVRRFNRRVTQRVGALDDHFLARDRSLGESRVLWEIGLGADGCDVRRLRAALDLDSGYLSRLLRSLEADGLVTVEPSAADGRVRTARLTPAGAAERSEIDRRADDHAWSLLAPLPEGQRQRLVDAMGQVERLLTAALVEIAPADPADPAAEHCLQAYYAEIDRRFAGGFDPARSRRAGLDDMRPPHGVYLVARLGDEAVGGGGLLFHGDEPTELKRLWVSPSARGLGVGRRLLAELEARAAATGSRTIRLDTNHTLTEAIAMYRSAGYREVDRFNDERYADHWFEKDLAPDPSGAGEPGVRGDRPSSGPG